jgi:hypothetical protein
MTDLTFTIKLTGADAGGQAAVQKVVDSLKELGVQAGKDTAAVRQTGKAFQEGAKGASAMAGAVGILKTLLGGLSVALVANEIKRLALGQIAAADAVGKLSQALGIGTEALSVYQFAAKGLNIDSEQLTIAFRNLAAAQQQAKNPASAAAAAFKAIGISGSAVAGLKLDEVFQKVANGADQFGASGAKLQALATILGPRVVTPLIPLLQKLANDGFAKAREEAEKLGLVFSEDAARKAADFNDALSRLQGSVRGLAGEFATGFAPALANVFDALTVSVEGSGSALQDFGKQAGMVLGNLLALALRVKTGFLNLTDALPALLGDQAAQGRIDARREALAAEIDAIFPSAETLAAKRAVVVGEVLKLELALSQAAK